MVKVGLKGYLLLRMPDLVPILLKDQKLPGTALLALATTEFGLECLEWEPAIIRDELSTYFNVPLTHAQSDKLQAGANHRGPPGHCLLSSSAHNRRTSCASIKITAV